MGSLYNSHSRFNSYIYSHPYPVTLQARKSYRGPATGPREAKTCCPSSIRLRMSLTTLCHSNTGNYTLIFFIEKLLPFISYSKFPELLSWHHHWHHRHPFWFFLFSNLDCKEYAFLYPLFDSKFLTGGNP